MGRLGPVYPGTRPPPPTFPGTGPASSWPPGTRPTPLTPPGARRVWQASWTGSVSLDPTRAALSPLCQPKVRAASLPTWTLQAATGHAQAGHPGWTPWLGHTHHTRPQAPLGKGPELEAELKICGCFCQNKRITQRLKSASRPCQHAPPHPGNPHPDPEVSTSGQGPRPGVTPGARRSAKR